MRDQYFYLEFTIGCLERFDALSRLIFAIKAEKDRIIASWGSDESDPVRERNWVELLDEPAVEWFANTFDFDSEEGKNVPETLGPHVA